LGQGRIASYVREFVLQNRLRTRGTTAAKPIIAVTNDEGSGIVADAVPMTLAVKDCKLFP